MSGQEAAGFQLDLLADYLATSAKIAQRLSWSIGRLAADDWRMEVVDENGIICFVLSFSVFARAGSSSTANMPFDPPTRDRNECECELA